MSEKLRELLSATMDGETDTFERRRVLDEARTNSELREYWYRQHLVRSVILGEEIDLQDQLRARLHAEMEELAEGEGPVVVPEEEAMQPQKTNWVNRVTGTAVAVAVAALVVINGDLFVGSDETFELVQPTTVQPGGAPRPLQTAPVMYDVPTPADRHRTDGFIVHHIQQNALNNPGAASLIRFITFDRKTPRSVLPDPATDEAQAVDRSAPIE